MKIKYIGLSDEREIKVDEIPEDMRPQEGLSWSPGSEIEVSDELGQWLTSIDRDLKDSEAIPAAPEPEPEELTDDQLRAEAKSLGISGRNKMNRDELLAAIAEAEAPEKSEEDQTDG